jgi:anti-anti-sigma factor
VRANYLQSVCCGPREMNPRERCIHEGDYTLAVGSARRAQARAEELALKQERNTREVVSLQISIREMGDVTIVDLRGKSTIDGGSSELLGSSLRKLVASGVRKLLLNLVNLVQVDSSGIGVIVSTFVSLRRHDGELKLLCPCGRVLEVLTVFRLLNTIPSFEDEGEALASFRPRSQSAAS